MLQADAIRVIAAKHRRRSRLCFSNHLIRWKWHNSASDVLSHVQEEFMHVEKIFYEGGKNDFFDNNALISCCLWASIVKLIVKLWNADWSLQKEMQTGCSGCYSAANIF